MCRNVKEFRLIISEVTEHWRKHSYSEYPEITFLLFNYLVRLCLGQYLPGSMFTKLGCIFTHIFSKGTPLLTEKNSLLHLIGRNYCAYCRKKRQAGVPSECGRWNARKQVKPRCEILRRWRGFPWGSQAGDLFSFLLDGDWHSPDGDWHLPSWFRRTLRETCLPFFTTATTTMPTSLWSSKLGSIRRQPKKMPSSLNLELKT